MASRRVAGHRGRSSPSHRSGKRAKGKRLSQAAPIVEGCSQAASVVNLALHRFPWPANPGQRYSPASPWLAVVNAKGPWGVWRHKKVEPLWIPWCRSIWTKRLWQEADDGLKVFCWEMWQWVADHDVWGIVWGDPTWLCRGLGIDLITLTARLEVMLKAGWLVYLTDAERQAAMSWRPVAQPSTQRRGGGKSEGGRGESGGGGQITGTGTEDRDRDRDSGQQISDPSARTRQITDSRERQKTATGTGTETVTRTVTAKVTGTAGKAHSESLQPAEPANLPKSDLGAATGQSRATGHGRGLRTRPQSARRVRRGEAVPLGEVLSWNHPVAVAFGRRMYEAIHGHAAPIDLLAAADEDKADVGVWVQYWVKHVPRAIPSDRYQAFEDRCFADTAEKRKVRSIKNLGRVAMGKKGRTGIVPGVLNAMANEARKGGRI